MLETNYPILFPEHDHPVIKLREGAYLGSFRDYRYQVSETPEGVGAVSYPNSSLNLALSIGKLEEIKNDDYYSETQTAIILSHMAKAAFHFEEFWKILISEPEVLDGLIEATEEFQVDYPEKSYVKKVWDNIKVGKEPLAAKELSNVIFSGYVLISSNKDSSYAVKIIITKDTVYVLSNDNDDYNNGVLYAYITMEQLSKGNKLNELSWVTLAVDLVYLLAGKANIGSVIVPLKGLIGPVKGAETYNSFVSVLNESVMIK